MGFYLGVFATAPLDVKPYVDILNKELPSGYWTVESSYTNNFPPKTKLRVYIEGFGLFDPKNVDDLKKIISMRKN